MRTTIDIPDHIFVEAKQLAAKQRRPLTVVVTESLQLYLAGQRQQRSSTSVDLPINTAAQPTKDIDLTDTSALWSIDDSL